MNELNNTLMSTDIGAEVTGQVLADVRGVNSMGKYAEETSKGVELHFAPNADSAPAVVVYIMPDPKSFQDFTEVSRCWTW